jgi:hypothetical protein
VKRLMTFLCGMITGAALLFGALNYHVIRADDGLHFVPKPVAQLEATYVDIRSFTVADWAQYPDLAVALINDDQRDLVEGAASDAVRDGIDQFFDRDSSP